MTKGQITSLILLGASIIYDIVPIDFIPDIPVIGWLDDMLVTSSAVLNCLMQFGIDASGHVYKAAKFLRWACIVIAVLIVILIIALVFTLTGLCM